MTWVLTGPTEAQRGRCQGEVERGDICVGCEGCVGVCQGENWETCDQENIRLLQKWSGEYGNQTAP